MIIGAGALSGPSGAMRTVRCFCSLIGQCAFAFLPTCAAPGGSAGTISQSTMVTPSPNLSPPAESIRSSCWVWSRSAVQPPSRRPHCPSSSSAAEAQPGHSNQR